MTVVGVTVTLVEGRGRLGGADEHTGLALALCLVDVQRELVSANDGGSRVDLREDVRPEVQVARVGLLYVDDTVADGVGITNEEVGHQRGAGVDVGLVFLKALLENEDEVIASLGGESHKGESACGKAQGQQEGKQLSDHNGVSPLLFSRGIRAPEIFYHIYGFLSRKY